MNIYRGDRLRRFADSRLASVKHPRNCQNDLNEFLLSGHTSRAVCGIYGLRRTGKTTLSLMAMKELGIMEKSAYILCYNTDSFFDVKERVEALLNSDNPPEYLFIDEVTSIEGFLNLSGYLETCGVPVVISGTDSAGLLFARGGSLLDRVSMIHTTYISFEEYHRLTGSDLDDFITCGGTFSADPPFKNMDTLDEYTNSAIVSNILHSVGFGRRNVYPARLYELYENGMLESAIWKVVEDIKQRFLLSVISRSFLKSSRYGSLKELAEQRGIRMGLLNEVEIVESIKGAFRMKNTSDIREEDITLIKNFLVEMDVLFVDKLSGHHVFTQPGMTYAMCEELAKAIEVQEALEKLGNENVERINELLKNDISGRIMESITATDVAKALGDSNIEIGEYRDDVSFPGAEIDLYVIDKETRRAAVFEIKHRHELLGDESKHLLNKEFVEKFENSFNCKVVSSSVIYQGHTPGQNENGIWYLNASEFLCNIGKKMDELLFCGGERTNEAQNCLYGDDDGTNGDDILSR